MSELERLQELRWIEADIKRQADEAAKVFDKQLDPIRDEIAAIEMRLWKAQHDIDLKVGDLIIITPEFSHRVAVNNNHSLLVINNYPIGAALPLERVDHPDTIYVKGKNYGTIHVSPDMAITMRRLWLAQHEAEVKP